MRPLTFCRGIQVAQFFVLPSVSLFLSVCLSLPVSLSLSLFLSFPLPLSLSLSLPPLSLPLSLSFSLSLSLSPSLPPFLLAQILYTILLDAIKPLCNFLAVNDTKLILVVLDVISKMLAVSHNDEVLVILLASCRYWDHVTASNGDTILSFLWTNNSFKRKYCNWEHLMCVEFSGNKIL